MSQSEQDAHIKEAWKLGHLRWMLRSGQKTVYDFFHASKEDDVVVACHRGFGKSFLASVIATEFGVARSNRSVRFFAPAKNQLRTITLPHFRQVLKTCPKEMAPRYHGLDDFYEFPSSSMIYLEGADHNKDAGRGKAADLVVLEEEAFMEDAEYLYTNILAPRAVLRQGKFYRCSTPPTSIDHQFADVMLAAEAKGQLLRMTIHDNPDLTDEIRAKLAEKMGGESSASYRRECLCELVTDDKVAVYPRLTRGEVVQNRKGALSSPWYPQSPKVIGVHCSAWGEHRAVFTTQSPSGTISVVSEIGSANGDSYRDFARAVHDESDRIWGTQAVCNVTADENQDEVVSELAYVVPASSCTLKNLRTALGRLGDKVQNGRFYIYPDCARTAKQVPNAVWDKTKKNLAVSSDGSRFGYLRALAAASEFDFTGWSPQRRATEQRSFLGGR